MLDRFSVWRADRAGSTQQEWQFEENMTGSPTSSHVLGLIWDPRLLRQCNVGILSHAARYCGQLEVQPGSASGCDQGKHSFFFFFFFFLAKIFR